jgi:hypothetical protein
MDRRIFPLMVTATFMLASCREETDVEAMRSKEAQLAKLAVAVESTVRYKHPPADLDEQGLLELATRHDPQLLANFAGFKVRVLSRERHALVLVCTADGQRRIMEDAACTVPFDRHHWQESAQPCDFTVDIASACPAP